MIAPTDPRHGRRAGYIAGCSDDCCRPHHLRYQKMSTLRRHREGSQRIDSTAVLERLEWWRARGVGPSAIGAAAKLGEGTLIELVTEHDRRCLKTTARKTLAITWDDLPDSTLVNANLTRARIYSLMAAGHSLVWICAHVDRLSTGGKWRDQDRMTLGLARSVLALYETAPDFGPSRHTATKAKVRGHVHPIGWDDPGTPAEPLSWRPIPGRDVRRKDDVDHAAVDRILAGDSTIKATKAERHEVIRRWPHSINALERLRPDWNVSRDLREMRAGEAA